MNPHSKPGKPRGRHWLMAGFLALLGLGWLMREPVRRAITEHAILANDAPDSSALLEVIQDAPDPARMLLAAWDTGKIVHREVAMRAVPALLRTGGGLPPEIERIVLVGAKDPDLAVRQVALGVLRDLHHPGYAALAAAQLSDGDPEVRLLGLQHLRFLPPSGVVQAVAGRFDDPDPLVAAMAIKLFEKWSGQEFGVKLSETTPVRNPDNGLAEPRKGSIAVLRSGAERARTWWRAHQTDPEFAGQTAALEPVIEHAPLRAPGFELPTLDGRTVRLSEFRGKVVLLNFWTTWCTACVAEIPALIELQQRQPKDVVILGVSLDFVPDDHGHIGGIPAVEDQGREPGQDEDAGPTAETLKRVRQRIARVVRSRGMTYPVLLDEHNEVGGQYNGGELPTTVIIDAEGNVRRRFIGARSLEVFEAMLRQAGG
ncbi:MAG: redoxin domain-containing protein [Verrucomicrobiales bacterium]|nr:redoxin domain-containing protein [Verrucomicrobiales bacterium]